MDIRLFRYVEMELARYNENKRELALLREEIIEGRLPSPEIKTKGGKQGNPTQSKGLRLASSASVLWLERSTGAIERALRGLGDVHCRIFELHYIAGEPWQGVCDLMPISRPTFFRRRHELVDRVAVEMGMKQY